MRAPAKPLVHGNPASVKCGKITRAPADAELTEMLAGRLRLRPPVGAKPVAAADAPSTEEESRLVVDGGKLSLAILARETFQLDTDLFESADPNAPQKPDKLDLEAPKFLKATFPAEGPVDIVPVEIGQAKLRAYVVRPREPNAPPGKDTALVLGLLVAREEGELESLGFYVRGETVRNATGDDLVGCTRLAERIASTLTPGPRALERTAGRRKLLDLGHEELTATVPADYVAVPAGSGARLLKLRPLSLFAGSINVSVADGAEKKIPEGVDSTIAGKLLGHPTQWHGKTSPKGGFVFAAEPIDDGKRTLEVLVKATRQAQALDEMRAVAETIELTKK